MIFASRAMLQSVFLCGLILMGWTSCMELNVMVTNEKNNARKNSSDQICSFTGGVLEVHTAADIGLLRTEVEQILAGENGSNTVANMSDGIGDTACSLNFKIKPGEIPTFDDPQIIRDRIDLDNLNDKYEGVKVVKHIWWCGDDLWSYDGCHKDGGIVVVRTTPSREGILWLHEIGHLCGLGHRDQQFAVMNPIIQPMNKNLNPDECARYR